MNRRGMLSWVGVSAAGALRPISSAMGFERKEGRQIVALESFCAKDVDHLPRLHSYLSQTLQPAMERIHNVPSLYMEAIIAPQAPQVLAFTNYQSFEEMFAVGGRISSRPEVRQARALLESTHALEGVQSQVLVASEGLRVAADAARLRNGIFELCSYYAPAWHDGTSARVTEVFNRAGICPIANALFAPGEHLSRFTFLIPFESLGASIDAWTKLDADAEWGALQRESSVRYGSGVKLTAKAIYKLTPYSRLA